MAYLLENSDIIKGGHLMVMIEKDNALVPIAFATSHNFSKSLQTQEISTKDHGDYAAVLAQRITWEATTENLYSISGYKMLNDVFKGMKPVKIYFGETNYNQLYEEKGIVEIDGASNWTAQSQAQGMTNNFGEIGNALITSLQVTAGAGDNATFSATFTGSGALQTATNGVADS